MRTRRELLLDAAIDVLGGRGTRALTHRAVDAEAGVAAGSTANYFSTRDALLRAVVDRVSALERERADALASTVVATTPAELAKVLSAFAVEATGTYRALTLARYAVLVDAGTNPAIREGLAATGSRVNAWFVNWLTTAGSTDPDRDLHIVANYLTGLILHELAVPAASFDPTDRITVLLESLAHQEEHDE